MSHTHESQQVELLTQEVDELKREVQTLLKQLQEAEEHQVDAIPPLVTGKVLDLSGTTINKHPDLVPPPADLVAKIQRLQSFDVTVAPKDVEQRAWELARIANSILRNSPIKRRVYIHPPTFMVGELEVALHSKEITVLHQVDPYAAAGSPWVYVRPGGRR